MKWCALRVARALNIPYNKEFTVASSGGEAGRFLLNCYGLSEAGRVCNIRHDVLSNLIFSDYWFVPKEERVRPFDPHVGDHFFYVAHDGMVVHDVFNKHNDLHLLLYATGNCFATPMEADAATEAALDTYKPEPHKFRTCRH